jgi:quercetin dioxygenase-like cupin family protein
MSYLKVSDLNPREIVPGFFGRFIHSEKITLAYWDVLAGAEIPPHQHVHEMVVNVIYGQLELTIGDQTCVLEPGMVGIIPSQVSHRARAITDCKLIDVFYPVRKDYR